MRKPRPRATRLLQLKNKKPLDATLGLLAASLQPLPTLPPTSSLMTRMTSFPTKHFAKGASLSRFQATFATLNVPDSAAASPLHFQAISINSSTSSRVYTMLPRRIPTEGLHHAAVAPTSSDQGSVHTHFKAIQRPVHSGLRKRPIFVIRRLTTLRGPQPTYAQGSSSSIEDRFITEAPQIQAIGHLKMHHLER